MKAKDKVLKINPKIVGVWDRSVFKVYDQLENNTTKLLGHQNRESWAWAEALRNLNKM